MISMTHLARESVLKIICFLHLAESPHDSFQGEGLKPKALSILRILHDLDAAVQTGHITEFHFKVIIYNKSVAWSFNLWLPRVNIANEATSFALS